MSNYGTIRRETLKSPVSQGSRSASPEEDFAAGRRTASSPEDDVLFTDRKTVSPFRDEDVVVVRPVSPCGDEAFAVNRRTASSFSDEDFAVDKRTTSPLEDGVLPTDRKTASPFRDEEFVSDRMNASPFEDKVFTTGSRATSPFEDGSIEQGLWTNRPGIEGLNDDNIELRYSPSPIPSPSPSPAFYDRYQALFGDDDWYFTSVLPLRRPDLDKVKYHSINTHDALNSAIRRRKFRENNCMSPLTTDSTFILVCRAMPESESGDDSTESGHTSPMPISSPRKASPELNSVPFSRSFKDEMEIKDVFNDTLDSTLSTKLSMSDDFIGSESSEDIPLDNPPKSSRPTAATSSSWKPSYDIPAISSDIKNPSVDAIRNQVPIVSPKSGKADENCSSPLPTSDKTTGNTSPVTPPQSGEKVMDGTPSKFTESKENPEKQRKIVRVDDSDQPEIDPPSHVPFIHRETTDKGKTSPKLRQKFASLSTVPLLGTMPHIHTVVKSESNVGTKSPVPSKSALVKASEIQNRPQTGVYLPAANNTITKEITIEARLCKADDIATNETGVQQALSRDTRKMNHNHLDSKTPLMNHTKSEKGVPKEDLQRRNAVKKGGDTKAPWTCSKDNHRIDALTRKENRALVPPQQKKWKIISTENRPAWNSNKALPKIPNSTNRRGNKPQNETTSSDKFKQKFKSTEEKSVFSDTAVLPAIKSKNTPSGTSTLAQKRKAAGISVLPTINKRNTSGIAVLPAIKTTAKGTSTCNIPHIHRKDVANNIGDVITKKTALPPIPSKTVLKGTSGKSMR